MGCGFKYRKPYRIHRSRPLDPWCDRGLRIRFVGEVSGWLLCGSLNGTARLCLELLVPQLETTNKQWHSTHAYGE